MPEAPARCCGSGTGTRIASILRCVEYAAKPLRSASSKAAGDSACSTSERFSISVSMSHCIQFGRRFQIASVPNPGRESLDQGATIATHSPTRPSLASDSRFRPDCRRYFHYFLAGTLKSTPKTKCEQVGDGYAVIQAQFVNGCHIWISKPSVINRQSGGITVTGLVAPATWFATI